MSTYFCDGTLVPAAENQRQWFAGAFDFGGGVHIPKRKSAPRLGGPIEAGTMDDHAVKKDTLTRFRLQLYYTLRLPFT